MTATQIVLLAAMLSGDATPDVPASPAPETVEFASGGLQLKAYLWKPPGPGPFPAVLFNHGRSDTPQQHSSERTITAAARAVGPVFARHGYVLLYPFRRGEGLSADQGPFIGDLLRDAEASGGADGRNRLLVRLMTTEHLADGTAALEYLKRLPGVDAGRIAIAGHSFGGNLALLEAEHDRSARAVVTFGAAAGSWESSPERRALLLHAIRTLTAPVLLLHPANDYSVAPGQAMADELARLGKPHALKIYPAFGRNPGEGHNFLYTDVRIWEQDVFEFLDRHVGR